MAGVVLAFDTTISPSVPNAPRKGVATTVAMSSTQTECDKLDIRGFKYLAVKPPASVTTLTFYGAETSAGSYVLINDLGTAGVVTLTASRWTTIDYTKLAPHHFIQMKSDQTVANGSCLASS